MNKTVLIIAGFLSFIFGFLSLILMLIGVKFSFLTWIDAFGGLVGFLIRIFMVIGGLMTALWAQTDWNKKDGLY